MKEIGRLITAMVTPFDEEGRVDYEQAKRLAKALLDSGSDGVILSGTTGESPTLSTEEKLRLFSEVKGAVNAIKECQPTTSPSHIHSNYANTHTTPHTTPHTGVISGAGAGLGLEF